MENLAVYLISGGLKTNEEVSDVSIIKTFSDQLAAVNHSNAWTVVETGWTKNHLKSWWSIEGLRMTMDFFISILTEKTLKIKLLLYEDPVENKLRLSHGI